MHFVWVILQAGLRLWLTYEYSVFLQQVQNMVFIF